MYTKNKPPGNHHWVLENNGQVIIWTCECGIRTTHIFSFQNWIWVNSFNEMQFAKLPKSCSEYKMIEALK